jgi:hypothetical protein
MQVTEHKDANKMSVGNIAIVVGMAHHPRCHTECRLLTLIHTMSIAPNVLRPRVETLETALRSPLLTQGVQLLLENVDQVFADVA